VKRFLILVLSICLSLSLLGFASKAYFSNVETSDSNTFMVAVWDSTQAVITLLGDETVNLNVGDSYEDAGATATDDVDGA